MLTTETPTPPRRPPRHLFRRPRSSYEELEPDELLHLIDQLEDERSRARKREGIWISIIAHILLFWVLLYGPKYLWRQPHVVNPVQEQKDLTVLTLPPDLLKQVKPKPQSPLSDKNRIAQSELDRKLQEQLRSLRGRPVPPAPKAPQEPPAPQQQAQAQPQKVAPAPPPPMRPVQQSQAPPAPPAPPLPSAPNFNTGPQTAGDEIRQAVRNAARNSGQNSSDYGMNAPGQMPLNAGVDILSDTMGVDFGPYMQRVIEATYRSWLPIIPESARPPLDKQGKVGIRFKIYPDGSVKQMILEFPSGDVSLDRAAWGGITGASPYPPLPGQFKGPFLELRFGFYYNIDPYKNK